MVDSETARFSFNMDKTEDVKELMTFVLSALEEKGYNPINQIIGYLLSGDPAYIPRHNNARTLIRKVERDELIETLVRFFLEHHYGDKE